MTSNAGERGSPSVGLLISVLVRYPEIASVQYEHRNKSLKFSFLLSGTAAGDELDLTRGLILSSLQALFYIQGKTPGLVDVLLDNHDNITVIQIRRDVASLSQEEISMVTEIMKERFGGSLFVERPEGFGDDDTAMQEEMIQEMLEDLKESKLQRNLVAFREEGRVLVYNK